LHGFAGLVARFRAGLVVSEVRELRVRIRLQPGQLGGGPAGRLPVGGRAFGQLENAMRARPRLDGVEAAVGRDRIEPAARRAAPVELRPRAPGLEERLLDEIVRLVERAHHPVAVKLERAAVGDGQALEGQPV